MRILILEDDPDVASFLEEALTKSGHEPTSFGHAGLALGAIARGKFELLICDIMLPNVNGLQAMRMARSQFPYLPIIAISAMEEDAYRDKSFEAGASCFMQKPIRVERLLNELRLVESSQAHLTVGILDSDTRHHERVAHDLASMGCDVHILDSFAAVRDDAARGDSLKVLLIEHGNTDLEEALAWTRGRDMAGVVFADDGAGLDEDKLMRAGASFCLPKPIDTEALVIQARFFVSPVPKTQAL